jgi:YfiR/HmsC-like
MVFLTLFAVLPLRLVAQSKAASEYEVKAAFLYNFAKFIDWPPDSFASPQSPFAICILGVDPFGHVMDNALQGKMVGSHPVSIQRVKEFTDLRHCQIAFVSSSESPRLPEILQSLKGSSVLVVGESEGFATAGGAIQFAIEDERVRFLINPDAAESARIKVSSKLLALAKIILPGAESGNN